MLEAEYIVHFGGFEMVVHCRVPCGGDSGRYYIESSARIPIDSSDTPTMAVFVAILLTALGILPDPPTLPAESAPTLPSHSLIVPRCNAGSRGVTQLPKVHFDIPDLKDDICRRRSRPGIVTGPGFTVSERSVLGTGPLCPLPSPRMTPTAEFRPYSIGRG
jgi:hypothetical protein